MKKDVRKHLISAGVRNLKDFGYPDVNENNILTDMIYVGFLRSMLRVNLGHGFDAEINQLLADTEEFAP